jgi:Receptor family ligand binding region
MSVDVCSQSKLERPWYDANDTDERNDMARRAFESLMTITLRKPDSERYRKFSEQVKEIAKQQYGDTAYGDGEVCIYHPTRLSGTFFVPKARTSELGWVITITRSDNKWLLVLSVLVTVYFPQGHCMYGLPFCVVRIVQVNSFVGAFHDAVILYALALNETLAAGLDPTNGTEITRRMWNRTFEG